MKKINIVKTFQELFADEERVRQSSETAKRLSIEAHDEARRLIKEPNEAVAKEVEKQMADARRTVKPTSDDGQRSSGTITNNGSDHTACQKNSEEKMKICAVCGTPTTSYNGTCYCFTDGGVAAHKIMFGVMMVIILGFIFYINMLR